jgi:hypothetical protein
MIGIEQPKYNTKLITNNGYNNDIIKALNNSFPTAAKQVQNIKFSGTTGLEKGRAIYNYLRNSIKYKKDPEGKQYIQLPARLINGTKSGDCKSLALSAAAFMAANGFKDIRLRYAAYSDTDFTPSHVYTVGKDERGADIIIDAVYKQYNKEVPYTFKKDFDMKIEVLSGLQQITRTITPGQKMRKTLTLEQLAEKTANKPFIFNAVKNEIARKQGTKNPIKYTPAQLKMYAQQLTARINKPGVPTIFKKIYVKELSALQNNNFSGNLIQEAAYIQGLQEEIGKLSLKKLKKGLKKINPKSILKAVKAVGLLVPRKAALALMALNFRGMATRASQIRDPKKLQKLWDRLGGKWSVLEKAIRNGKKKKPLFGANKKKIKVIKGIGAVIVEDDSIGAAPAVAAFLAAAGPFLAALSKLFKQEGVQEVPEGGAFADENQNFDEVQSSVQDNKPGLIDYVNKATEIATATGIIPSRKNTPSEDEAERGLATDEEDSTSTKTASTTGTTFSPSPILLVGAAAALYFITKKK